MIGLREPELKIETSKLQIITSVRKDVSLKNQKTGEVYSVDKLIIIDEAGSNPIITYPPELKNQRLSEFNIADGKNIFGKPKSKEEKPKANENGGWDKEELK